MRILLLSAYDAHSHRRWRQGLVAALPDNDWTVLAMPPRHFNWRVRGNSLGWAFAERHTLEQPYDIVIATSMCDLSALRGMVPALGQVPSLVYCHENQFDYPEAPDATARIEPKITSLYAMLSAERVLFNSDYNRRTLLEGTDALLKQMPDFVPDGIVEQLEQRSQVLPVPLEAHWFEPTQAARAGKPFTLLWNHRWEFDKAPERLFAALQKLLNTGIDFRIHVVGQQFRRQPAVFADMYPRLEGHIGQWGYVEDDDAYRALLRESHVVISTALHEFQGLAVMEAAASGCSPVVPDRLAYTEYLPDECRYASFPDDAAREGEALADAVLECHERFRSGGQLVAPDMQSLSWPVLADKYAAVIETVAHAGAGD